jgi:AbiU2
MTYHSPEEVGREHLKTLGPQLGPVYHALWNECLWLQFKWRQFLELYGTNQERIDLLNRTASQFFGLIQDTCWEDTLLHLSRLTDKPDFYGSKKTLTVQSLPALISEPEFSTEIQRLVDEALEATTFARDWRNRRIAHRDLALTLNKGAKPLAPASRKHVQDALQAVWRVIERVYAFYFKSELPSRMTEPIAGDAVSLLYVVRDGLEAEEKRRERLRRREITPEDLQGPRKI